MAAEPRLCVTTVRHEAIREGNETNDVAVVIGVTNASGTHNGGTLAGPRSNHTPPTLAFVLDETKKRREEVKAQLSPMR
jgi:4-hydroxy-3-methylbut-2-enyl diphosphate reductase IspH